MKKVLLLIVLLLTCFTITSCEKKNQAEGQVSTPQATTNSEKQQESESQSTNDVALSNEKEQTDSISQPQENKVFGVTFLGYDLDKKTAEEALRKELTQDQMNQLNFVEFSGTESFLIVPRDNNMIMNVYELTLDNEGQKRGALIHQCENGGPLYLKCNVSDIVPNVVIVVQDGNTEFTYVPAISLKDGSVALGEWGYNR